MNRKWEKKLHKKETSNSFKRKNIRLRTTTTGVISFKILIKISDEKVKTFW